MNIINVGYHSTNYYALETNNGKLLVDCGWPGTFLQFAAELKRKGLALNEIKYILATHFHPDHAGLVQELKNLGTKLILMESQAGFIQPLNKFNKTRNVPFTEILEYDNTILKFEESRKFLASLGIDGEIISTPGHSDDSVTLILDEGFAFTGDLPPRFLVMEEDRVTKGGWDKIYQHPITRIFPAHGS
ncbi:MAG: MBL fold metallo-hydrolase [Chloroflexi bacterium]|nr:MBL fold metallo-hydrolase [Chloroflexota bacterium]MBI1856613.1 MBL fold metallo-hydrolase [Chloroflexota bacterium]MBI3341103.1 MBL fold metallo-hydrolase [Chloroflexota bacterium]